MRQEDCIYYGEVQIKPNIFIDGCTVDYIKWCKFGCKNCKNYTVIKDDQVDTKSGKK